jgi:DNA polymerase-3 subunit epsilon
VIEATEQEVTAHEEVLVQLDKASGGKTVWRSLSAG